MMRKARAGLMAILLVFAGGCAEQMEPPSLEERGLVEVLGVDPAAGQQLKITGAEPAFSEEAKEKTHVYATVAKQVHQALMIFSRESERTVSPEQLKAVLFNEEFARTRPLKDVVKALYRDGRIGDQVRIAVVKGSTHQILQGKYPEKPPIGTYLNQLLRPRRETHFHFFPTIHDYMNRTTSNTSDITIPYLEKEQAEIRIGKTALFRQHQMVGFLSPDQGTLVQSLRVGGNLPDLSLKVINTSRQAERMVINLVQSTPKIRLTGNNPHVPVFEVAARFKGTMVEYHGTTDLESEKGRAALEKRIGKHLENDIVRLLEMLRSKDVDPIGFGEILRAHHDGDWNRTTWREALQQARFHVHIRFQLTSSGTMR